MSDERTGDRGRFRAVGMMAAAALCGFAEATLFFIVPDVLLTWTALDRLRLALVCCLMAVAGALVGGAVMMTWGRADAPSALAALEHVPAVSREMIRSAGDQLSEHGWYAMLRGSVSGVPYKIFAVQAGVLGISMVAFLLISIPARLARFVGMTLVAGCLSLAFANTSIRSRRVVYFVAWVVFYVWFFRQAAC